MKYEFEHMAPDEFCMPERPYLYSHISSPVVSMVISPYNTRCKPKWEYSSSHCNTFLTLEHQNAC
jgi:hypothetical protein